MFTKMGLINTGLLLFLVMAGILCGAAVVEAQDNKDDQEAKLESMPEIDMPSEAKLAGIGGLVIAFVNVDEAGNVTSVEGVAGPDWVCPDVKIPAVIALRKTAMEAAMKAKFSPALKKGKAVRSSTRLNFQFKNSKPDPILPPDLGVRAVESDSGQQTGTDRSDPGNTELKALQAEQRPILIQGGVLNGKAKSLPKPAYPAAAKAVRASGSVSIHVVIDVDGAVFSAEAMSGHPLLRAAARFAACDSRFAPTLLQGQPVKVSGSIVYNFVP